MHGVLSLPPKLDKSISNTKTYFPKTMENSCFWVMTAAFPVKGAEKLGSLIVILFRFSLVGNRRCV